MKRFVVGKRYSMRSVCDHECVWEYEVVGRTDKTVTLSPVGDTVCLWKDRKKTFRISNVFSDSSEAVLPIGRYSMCPILRAV